MKNQLLASFLGLLLICLPVTQVAAQGTLVDVVCFETNVGEFCIRLFPEDAPQNVANFLKYVNDTDYNGTFIHRSARNGSRNFVIQGGGFKYDNALGPLEVPKDAPVANEFKRSNTRGTVAMAKVDGNPNSATSEWFINMDDNSSILDGQNGGFTVFGEVVIGMNIVDNIARLPAINLTNFMGGAFGEVPMLDYDSQIAASDFVTIIRAFVTQRDPSAPTASDPFPNVVTTTSYSGAAAFLAPVRWTDGKLYRMIFIQSGTPPTYIFTVDTKLITTLSDKGQSRATFDGQFLTIPSVKIPGGIVTDVRLQLTNQRTLEFTLVSFNRYTGVEPL